MKLFYSGPFITAETLVVMLEKHSISATCEPTASASEDPNDLGRPARVWVAEKDFDVAHRLFYGEKKEEL